MIKEQTDVSRWLLLNEFRIFEFVGVFYCGNPVLAKELKQLSVEMTQKTSTRFEFHKEYF